MSIIHPHRTYPEDVLTPVDAIWWRDNCDLFLRVLTQAKYRSFYGASRTSNNLLIYPPECNIKENILNGRKPKRSQPGLDSGDVKSNAFRWLNVSLTSEDLNILEQETASLEQLSLAYVQLGERGFGLSVKYIQLRNNYSVSIYGPDNDNDGQPCGLSGASTNLRDALLVCLYRFNHKLGGSFDGATNTDKFPQQSRFR